MLDEIRIQGLGVIDDAVLELGPGLTVVTGETGAGKTMVLQGLALLFGGRADTGRVRPGAPRAVVEGRLLLPPNSAALQRADEAGAEWDDDGLLLARTVGSDGRSRAHLGGRTVPVGVLAEVAEHVLVVHGQSDQQRLLRPGEQRAALDRYAGEPVLRLRTQFETLWQRRRDVLSELDQLREAAQERVREAELLRLGLAEVEAADPQPGEAAALVAEIERLANADELRAAAVQANVALSGDESALDAPNAVGLLTQARRGLEQAGRHDDVLAGLAGRLAELAHLLGDVAVDVASYAATVDADPVRLGTAQERLAVLTALTRRHGLRELDEVLEWAETASRRLLELDGDDDRIAELTEAVGVLDEQLASLAGELSEARREAARRFAQAVAVELAELAMPKAQVTAEVRQREAQSGLRVGERILHAGPHGVDEVELLLAAHPGAPALPLQRGASGGELSRVMLAVEVVFADTDPVPVMVFDEVDAGVGGRAAVEVGRRLARLARDHQVLVVTHLPQVAAFADRHVVVRKGEDATGGVTRSDVEVLSAEDRVLELSRMLAGSDSDLARAHAEELLRDASPERDAPVSAA